MHPNNQHLKKSIILSISLFLFFSSISLFADPDDEKEGESNVMKPGSWALQFQVKGNFILGSFDGTMFSGKYHFTETSAIRFGFSPSVTTQDSDSDALHNMADTLASKEGNDYEGNNIELSTDLVYLQYLGKSDMFHFYVGIGPRFEIDNYYTETIEFDRINEELSIFRKRTYDSDSWGLGAVGVIGVEVALTKSISVSAEYNSSYIYYTLEKTESQSTWSEDNDINYKSDYEKKENITRSIFTGNSVKMGLTIYF